MKTIKMKLGAMIAVLVGMFACQRSEAETVIGTYHQTFVTPTNFHGMNMVGPVTRYSTNDGVEFGRLAADAVLCGKTPLPAGTGIHFTPDGKPEWCFLPKNHEIKGHLFIGGGHDWMTCFYPGGELKSGGLACVEVIDGIPCAAGVGAAIEAFWGKDPRTHFYEDGKLKSAQVAITFRHRGQIIEKGQRVDLKPDGSIESIK